jgi:ribulose bisphosphate carboxylase small subunit
MRITQGTFSYLPDLTDAEIAAQIDYALGKGWSVSVEHTDDPHPRNVYWEMWADVARRTPPASRRSTLPKSFRVPYIR